MRSSIAIVGAPSSIGIRPYDEGGRRRRPAGRPRGGARQRPVGPPAMIARSWHGRVPAAKADAYYVYLRRTGLPDYAATPGNRGVLALRRTEGDVTHFVLTTLWDSMEAIRVFAGDDVTRARYYPEDDDYLLERAPFVIHHEVLVAEMPSAPPERGENPT